MWHGRPLWNQEREPQVENPRPRVSVAGRRVPLPRSRALRILCGALLIVFGMFGFLPVLGFWMVPVGLLFLSYDVPMARRLRRRVEVWWYRRRAKNRD